MPEYRARFDARIEFVNGGGLTAEGFRLDLPSRDASEAEIGRLLVRHLGLAMVGSVLLTDLEIVEEAHKGSRGVIEAPGETDVWRVVDLSHPIHEGLITLPGIPAPVITPLLTHADSVARYAPGTVFAMDVVTMAGNTGTYLDSPYHRYPEGRDLSGLDLATLVDLPAETFHLDDMAGREIPASVFLDRDVRGKAVLLHTGWSRHFGTPAYADGAPFLGAEGAVHLAEQGVALVGIDAINIDDMSPDAAGERPAHTRLLGDGIHVVEHLTGLAQLPPSGARFTAAPLNIRGLGTSPVRAFARVPGDG
jgi:kynurenine formamidase